MRLRFSSLIGIPLLAFLGCNGSDGPPDDPESARQRTHRSHFPRAGLERGSPAIILVHQPRLANYSL